MFSSVLSDFKFERFPEGRGGLPTTYDLLIFFEPSVSSIFANLANYDY
jgi:hypothetical protein